MEKREVYEEKLRKIADVNAPDSYLMTDERRKVALQSMQINLLLDIRDLLKDIDINTT